MSYNKTRLIFRNKRNLGSKSLKSCSMCILPIEIIASEILPRLPVTTLLSFKCVSKFFYKYISSKAFIDLHLRNCSKSDANHLLMVFTTERARLRCLYLIDLNLPGSPARYLSLPQPFCNPNRFLKVVGSCNGLLCLSSFPLLGCNPMYYALFVNPCTGHFIANISLSTPPLSTTCSGFAYDAVNKDYKLIVVEYGGERQHRDSNIFRYRKVSVYSMKSNSWRLLETSYLGEGGNSMCEPSPDSNCVLMNNDYLMHWLLTARGGMKSVVCFNLESEQWTADVPLPDSDDFKSWPRFMVKLGILNGCLCLSAGREGALYKFHVWIMKEYRAQDSWTKFSFDVPKHRVSCPVFAYEQAAIMKDLLVYESKPQYSELNKVSVQTFTWYNINVRDNTAAAKKLQLNGAPRDLQGHLLCIASLATGTGCGDRQSQNYNKTKQRIMIDNQVKIVQSNLE